MQADNDMKMVAMVLYDHLCRIDAISNPDLEAVLAECDRFLSSKLRARVFTTAEKKSVTYAVIDRILKEYGC